MNNLSNKNEPSGEFFNDVAKSFEQSAKISANAARFSTMLYEQKFLIIKTPPKGSPFVVAEVYTENYSQEICKSLQEMENAKYEN